MIGFLTGTIISMDDDHIMVNTQSGIGFNILVPIYIIKCSQISQQISLLTSCFIKEDKLILFGFETQETKKCFLQLIKIKGISGKYAIKIISALKVNGINDALKSQNTAAFSSISGIGKKLAIRIVSELEQSFDLFSHKQQEEFVDNAITALTNLGYTKNNAEIIVNDIYKKNNNISLNDLIKLSLQTISITND